MMHRYAKGNDPLAGRNTPGVLKGAVQYFHNYVDHFDPLNNATYQQRFTVDDSAWSPGNPIFIFLSGEAPMEFFEFQEVSAINWAHDFGAMYISLEHRYYGESNPVPDFSTENMKYLSSRQALADAAHFLTSYNATLTNPGPWVVFGCSYSGALSAWFRAKYPNLVVGSIAPSGPVEAQSNYTSFFGQFSRSAEPDCVDATRSAVVEIAKLMETSTGRASLAKTFSACEPLTPENYYYFLWQLTSVVGSADQMDNPPTWILNTTCSMMTADTGDLVANFAKAYDFNVGQPDLACNSFNEEAMIKAAQSTATGPGGANRSWWFQKCTEFGYFKGAYNNTSIFFPTLDVEHIVGYCGRIFGIPGMKPAIDYTNDYYGGYDLKGSNILFTNGMRDPWHLLSITENQPPTPTSSVQAVTYQAGHCAPMTKPTANDPPSLVAARLSVKNFLGEILAGQ